MTLTENNATTHIHDALGIALVIMSSILSSCEEGMSVASYIYVPAIIEVTRFVWTRHLYKEIVVTLLN
jgi:hypothetical protein